MTEIKINTTEIKLKSLSNHKKYLDYLNSLNQLTENQIKLKAAIEFEIKKLQEDLDKNK